MSFVFRPRLPDQADQHDDGAKRNGCQRDRDDERGRGAGAIEQGGEDDRGERIGDVLRQGEA